MPPKVRVQQEMVLEAAFQIAREGGIDCVNARAVAGRLQCSTQPVLYNFSSVDALKRAVYRRADEYHSAWILQCTGRFKNPLLEIGMHYIEFAAQERNLFRLLFQTDHFADRSLAELAEDGALLPVLEAFGRPLNTDAAQVKAQFLRIFFPVHGIASMIANNSMAYDEAFVRGLLENTFGEAGEGENDGKEEER